MSLIGSMIVAAQTVWSSGSRGVGRHRGRLHPICQRHRFAHWHGLPAAAGPICGYSWAVAPPAELPALSGRRWPARSTPLRLIIGGYSPNSLAPVAVSALIGYLIAHALSPAEVGIVAPDQMTVAVRDLIVSGMIGVLCAAAGILIMRGVAICDALFARFNVPLFLRTTIGGLAVGLLAAVAPQVMSSGHGALHFAGILNLSLWTVALLFILKIVASIISLGSGFRGGLFFSSLLIGALGGQLLAVALVTIWPNQTFDANAYAVISMSALSAAVIGGPLTMTFIALETTGDLWLTTAVLIAVIISSQVTREMFGYSFATWRFHLRGETIRSAADIGWMRDLTVGKMMRHDVHTVSAATVVASFREAFPLGSSAAIVAVDDHGRYVGMVLVADAHATEVSPDQPIKALLRATGVMLMPGMAIKEAVLAFDQAETEALAVVDSRTDRRVIGFLTEAYALRRYAAELERRRKELIGEE